MRGEFYQQLTNDLETARAEGLFKEERIITSAQPPCVLSATV